jgi:hypothetical protein
MYQEEITTQHLEEEFKLQCLLNRAVKAEEENWQLKSKSLWLKVGDRNTSLFHKQVNVRVLRNNIREMNLEEGTKIMAYKEIKEVVI